VSRAKPFCRVSIAVFRALSKYFWGKMAQPLEKIGPYAYGKKEANEEGRLTG